MNHEQIKKALHEQGLSFAALAAATGRSYQSLTIVSQGKAKSRPSALIIASAIGKPVEEVFPNNPEYARPDKTNNVAKAKEILIAAGLSNLVA